MIWSKTFIPTLREAPADAADEGRKRLARAGFLRERGAGGRVWLPLGQRSLARIEATAREELVRAGGEEVRAESGRALLAAAGELRSYRQLPRLWFGFSSAVCRAMAVGTDPAPVCTAVVQRWGIPFSLAEAGAGLDIVAQCDGDRELLRCAGCGALSASEWASSAYAAPELADVEGDLKPEPFHTPGQKTIADIAAFTGLPESRQMKSVVMVADGKPVLALLRGDHQMSEAKFLRAVDAAEARPARADEILEVFGASAGSLGPIGTRARIVMDAALAGRRNMICGANRDDHHLLNVTPGEDFQAEVVDIRQAAAGERCVKCGGELATDRGLTLASVQPARAATVRVTDADGRESSPAVFECVLNTENALFSAARIFGDKDGMVLPKAIAPVDAVITPVSADPAQMEAAERIAAECEHAGIECLLDDRDERPGVKFKDADLIGAPFRVTVGKKLPQGMVELVARAGRVSDDVPVDQVARVLRERL